jgi:hypothetical protein
MKFHNATVSYLHAAKHGKSYYVPGPEQPINQVLPTIRAAIHVTRDLRDHAPEIEAVKKQTKASINHLREGSLQFTDFDAHRANK